MAVTRDRLPHSELAAAGFALETAAGAREALFAARQGLAAQALRRVRGTEMPLSGGSGAAPVRVAATLVVGQTLRIGAGLDDALGSGWNDPEEWGVWSSANQARLCLRVEDRASLPLVMDLKTEGLLSPDGEQALRVTAPTGQLAVVAFEPGREIQTVSLLLTADDLDDAGFVELRLETTHLTSPEAVGRGADKRLLGLSLGAIGVRGLVGGGAASPAPDRLPVLHHGAAIDVHYGLADTLLSGWSYVEEVGVWSVREVAEIAFALPADIRMPVEIELDLVGFVADGEPVQVAVTSGGATRARAQFDADVGRRAVSFSVIAGDDPPAPRRVRLAIIASRTVSPSELGISADGRPLGVQLLSLAIKRG